MVSVVRLALLLVLLSGCSSVCETCFRLEINQYDGSWTDCCTYQRQDAIDPVLIRLTRLDGAEYRAGLGVACTWETLEGAFPAALVALDAEQVDAIATFNVDFSADHDQSILSVDCQPSRPPPQYPDVLLYVRDPDLGAQFDPVGAANDEAVVRLVPEIVPASP